MLINISFSLELLDSFSEISESASEIILLLQDSSEHSEISDEEELSESLDSELEHEQEEVDEIIKI